MELVPSIYAAFERGDFSSAEWAHPDIEYVRADGPEPRSWTGLAGMAEGMREWLSAWQEFRAEAFECRDLDGESVLVRLRYSGRGKSSGLDVERLLTEVADLVHVQDGKVTKIVHYFDGWRALADVGLAPEGGS